MSGSGLSLLSDMNSASKSNDWKRWSGFLEYDPIEVGEKSQSRVVSGKTGIDLILSSQLYTEAAYAGYISLGEADSTWMPVLKRQFFGSDSHSRSAPVVDLTKARAEKQAIAQWLQKLTDLESDIFDNQGEILVPARAALELLLIDHGSKAIAALKKRFLDSRASASGLYAVCDAMGRMQSETAKKHAANFLADLLKHPRAEGRDAAVLGIALLDDPQCAPALRAALASERSGFLRETMTDVLSQM